MQHNLVAQSGDPEGTGKGGESVFRCEPNFHSLIIYSLLIAE